MRIDCPPRPSAPAQYTSRPLSRGTAEPPEIPIGETVRCLDLSCRRGLDPAFRNDLPVVPAPARKDQLADFRHVARSQTQSPSGIGIAPDPIPLDARNAQRLEQRC